MARSETSASMSNPDPTSRSETLLHEVEEIARVGGWEWDISGNQVRWTSGLYRLYGVDSSYQPTFEGFLGMVHPTDREAVIGAVQRSLETGEPFEVEHGILRPDGAQRILRGQGRVIRDEAGRPLRMVGTAQDVTRLRSLEHERDLFFDLSLDAICIAGLDGSFRRVSPSFAHLLGYTVAELMATPYLELIHPEDREATVRELGRLAEGVPTLSYRVRCLCRNGGHRLLEWSVAPHLQTGLLYSIGRDVTDQEAADRTRERLIREQAAREAAEEAEARARFLAEAGRILASSLDYETTLRSVADLAVSGTADWCAVDLVAASGELQRIAVAHPDRAKVEFAHELVRRYPPDPTNPVGVYQVLRTREPILVPRVESSLLERLARDAEHLRLLQALDIRSYMVVPLVARGQVLGAITLVVAESERSFTAHDLDAAHELARLAALAVDNAQLYREVVEANRLLEEQAQELEMQAEELQTQAAEMEENQAELEAMTDELQAVTDAAEEARARAEEANASKSQFLASMSHELRTPLNAIGGYAELIEIGVHGPVTEAQRECLIRIRRNQQHLLLLVNDLLNFAKLEAGQVRYEIADVPVGKVLAEMQSMIEPQLDAKGLRYVLHEGDPGVTARADRDRVQQIVLNLLSNATKFTPAGGRIELGWEVDERHVHIHVSDTGPGIPADKLEKIFEPFVQVERGSRTDGDGVGLGLAISRDLARALQGELRVRSEVGNGSVFTLTLPVGANREEG